MEQVSEFISRDEILEELHKMWSCNADEWGQGYDEGINKAIDMMKISTVLMLRLSFVAEIASTK